MSYDHHHVSHQPLTPSGDSSPYPPPPPPSVVYNHTHHSPSPPPGYQGYYYEGYPSLSGLPPSPPPRLSHRNDYNYHNGCTSFLTGCLATLCCCCLLEDCIF
ncbi:hypothetical protein V6N13_134893 [Hibiscus sabdariffa]